MKKASAKESLSILESAHYSIRIVVTNLKTDSFKGSNQKLMILEEELQLIQDEIKRLQAVINSI